MRHETKISPTAGFTLSELLIALAILGVIAVFTIPKVLQNQQDSRYKAMAKEMAGSIEGAFQSYELANQVTGSVGPRDLTPYLNYVKADTSAAAVDGGYNDTVNPTFTCDQWGSTVCLRMHNGGALIYWTGDTFGGTASTSVVNFMFDPDGKVTDGTTNGPGKSVGFYLYLDGRLRTDVSVEPNSTWFNGASTFTANPCATCDPPWFSWN